MVSPKFWLQYTPRPIDHEMDTEEIYRRLLSRLVLLATVGTEQVLMPDQLRQLAGRDKWGNTLIKAFTLWAEDGDFDGFLRGCAEAHEPWEIPEKTGR